MKITVLQDHLRSGGTERHSILLSREFARMGHGARLVTFRPGGRLAGLGRGRAPLASALRHRDRLVRAGAAPARSSATAPTSSSAWERPQTASPGGSRGGRRPARSGRGSSRPSARAGGCPGSTTPRCAGRRTSSPTAARRPTSWSSRHGLDRDRLSVIHNALVFPASPPGRDEAAARPARRRPGIDGAPLGRDVQAGEEPARARRDRRRAAGGPGLEALVRGGRPGRASCERLAARSSASPGGSASSASSPTPAPSTGRPTSPSTPPARRRSRTPSSRRRPTGFRRSPTRRSACANASSRGGRALSSRRATARGFAAALALLASDTPAERAARAAEARAFALGAFDPGRQVGAYIGLFESLLRGAAPAPRP